MGDGKRAQDIEREVASELEKAGEYVRADVAETRQEWHDQLHNDKEQLTADVARDKEKLHEVIEEVRHPEQLAAAAEAKLAHAADEAREAVHAVEHPSEIVADAKQAVAEKKAAFDETTATIAAEFTSSADKKRLPVVLRVFGVLLIVGAGASLPGIAKVIYRTAQLVGSGAMGGEGTSTIVVTFVHLAVLVALAVALIVFGVRLIRNQRRWAALLSYVLYVLIIAGGLCSIMLSGISIDLVFYLVALVVTIALQSYLDPTLLEERRARRKAREAEEHQEGEAGTLGRDPSGKGYIALNFFNLFWIFVVASILGLFMEEIVHFLFVVPGQWQDRAGLLFGPFSPIYGCGAVLMTLFLNRFHKSNWLIIFLVAAVIGGGFEALTSLFMQYAFGAVAWDYSNMPGSLFGGRTCLPFMACWGLLGVVWIKLLLPFMLRLVNFIPWNWRYVLTTVAACFMLVDAVMTLQSLDCWYMRLSGDKVDTPIQQFYDHEFGDTYMADRFQSMTIHPADAVRGK
ncbi:putative ABC transporter permease [Adlercreutzia sp. R21]|uniref:ABC transporter permease n=1 Tax=Adlercreutzia wanghongyangiae TaxID=3111451 RepID=A0ABU6IEL8_9ACTN|nr:putative ABC transporter permease [Adlercreutzia sp. R21]MEC4174879.1 putative ABC transporter permease [Adlercreutzia sp. R7]MEC4185153.1 putative ABC transporter permease [Adlercreutzia sp. R21]